MAEKVVKSNKEVEKKEKPSFRNYIVSKRSEDNKWQVKFMGGEKAIKLFDTKAEAVEYTKKMAENQDGTVLIKPSKGKMKGKFQKR